MSDGNALRAQRIGRGFTQATLARSVGISQQLLSKLEKGTIAMSPERAQSFAAVLGCKAIDLLPAFSGQPVPEGSEETDLVKIYREISPDKRRALMHMARALRMEQDNKPTLCAIAN